MPSWPNALPRGPRFTAIARPRHLPRFRRPSLTLIVALLVTAALLSGGWVWLRDSSLVAVQNVVVSGATGLGAPAVRSALTGTAQQMTTLHVDRAALDDAVARFPLVKSLTVTTKFPHGMTIEVHERQPVAALTAPGGTVAVASDGVILSGIPTSGLPAVSATSLVSGPRVVDPTMASEVALLALAPKEIFTRIAGVSSAADGLTVTLRSGPLLRFGDGERLRAKWVAANRVLADPQAAGAGYIDVSIPERPASGPLAAASPAADPSQTATQ